MRIMAPSPRRLLGGMCAAEVLAMLGVFAFPALLPTFQAEWALSNTEAGWINGIYFAGNAASVAFLMSATDRVDARHVYRLGALVSALAGLGFAFLAQGFWSALILRGLAGVGLAATYMPGLKALVDRYSGAQARAVSFYTATFSLGTAGSFLVTGAIAPLHGWRAAFLVAGLGALGALLIAQLLLDPRPPGPVAPGRLLDFRPVFRNRRAMAYVLAYGAHCWELFGQRGWMVAFLVFAAAAAHDADPWPAPTLLVSASGLVAMAASILGGELAMRIRRPLAISLFMLGGAVMAAFYGFAAGLPYGAMAILCLVYNALVQGDSAALTAGTVAAADPIRRGSTMAVHSLIGFIAAFLSPVVVGMILDGAGGAGSVTAWGLAFLSLGVAAALGPLALALLLGRAGAPPDKPG